MLKKLPKQVQWHEGMLLRPQHLQQAEMRIYESMAFCVKNAKPFNWGFLNLEVDKSAISSGVMRILSFEAIMKDGSYMQYDYKVDPELSLKLSSGDGDQEDIFLAIADVDTDAGYANQNDKYPRYLSRSDKGIRDQNTGEGEVDTPVLVPNLRLLHKSELSHRHTAMRIVKVSKSSDNFIDMNYTPACININVGSDLGKRCLGLVELLRSKINYLLNRTLSSNSGVVSKDYANIVNLMSFGLLEFESLLKSEQASPFELYLCLCRMSGFIRGVDGRIVPPVFDAYDHEDIDVSFLQVILFIENVINTIDDNYWIINFTPSNDVKGFSLDLQESWHIGEKIIIGAKSRNRVITKDFEKWLMSSIITTSDHVDQVKEMRVLGAKRRLIDGNDSMKLSCPEGMLLLEVIVDEEFITSGRELLVFNPDTGDCDGSLPAEVILYLQKE